MSTLLWAQDGSANLSRPCHAQRCQQRIGAVAAVWGEHAFDKTGDIGAVEHVELTGIFLEDLGEGKFLDGAAAIIWWIEGDVLGWGIAGFGLLHSEEAFPLCSLSRPESEINLEEIMRLLRSHNSVTIHCTTGTQGKCWCCRWDWALLRMLRNTELRVVGGELG
jgi:hypothetical protein